jgi:hypothetical protein
MPNFWEMSGLLMQIWQHQGTKMNKHDVNIQLWQELKVLFKGQQMSAT